MNTFFTDPEDKDLSELDFENLSLQEMEEVFDDWDEGEDTMFDWDGDALASAGFGTDEDYGGYSD